MLRSLDSAHIVHNIICPEKESEPAVLLFYTYFYLYHFYVYFKRKVQNISIMATLAVYYAVLKV